MPRPYRVGFENPNVKTGWSERILAVDPHAVFVTGPCATFAFGAVVAVCPDRQTAEIVADALNVAAAITAARFTG